MHERKKERKKERKTERKKKLLHQIMFCNSFSQNCTTDLTFVQKSISLISNPVLYKGF